MPKFQFGTTGYENGGEIGRSRRVAKRTEAGIRLVRSSPLVNLVLDAVWNNELEPLPKGEEPERASHAERQGGPMEVVYRRCCGFWITANATCGLRNPRPTGRNLQSGSTHRSRYRLYKDSHQIRLSGVSKLLTRAECVSARLLRRL